MLDKPKSPPLDRDVLMLREGHESGESTSDQGEAQQKAGQDDQDAKDEGSDKPADNRPLWRKHPIALILGVLLLIAVIVAGILYYLHARHFESTDDAFIDARPVSVSAEVTGNIVDLPVTDNQVVHAGDVLARIDDRNYTAAVVSAQGQIDAAQASYDNFEAQVSAQKSQARQAEQQVSEAQAALEFAKNQDDRSQQLVKSGYGTVQQAQQTASDLIQRKASLDAAVANRNVAEKQIAGFKAQQRNAEAQLEQAKGQKATADANQTRTVIHATADARVTRLTGAVGFVATQGQALMVLVPLDVWVTANFKETQLTDMRPGQAVDVEVDAFGRSFPGHVDSVQAGSGTAFSLLPAQNATGNYVKVVQRVPVKITFDKRPDVELGPGFSVVPSVTVR